MRGARPRHWQFSEYTLSSTPIKVNLLSTNHTLILLLSVHCLPFSYISLFFINCFGWLFISIQTFVTFTLFGFDSSAIYNSVKFESSFSFNWLYGFLLFTSCFSCFVFFFTWDLKKNQEHAAQFLNHIEAGTRLPPFSRRHIQMHFLEWKCINFDENFTEVCSQVSN